MIKALILICILHAPCDTLHARVVMRVPGEFAMPTEAFLQAQALVASTEMGRTLAKDERISIKFTHANH